MDAIKHPMLLSQASSMSVLEAARFYLEREICVLPVEGKHPAVYWVGLETRRTTNDQFQRWQRLFKGVGIVCGAVSNNLVVMDLDGEEAVDIFADVFPHLFDTYVVISGSGRGRHLYFYVDNLPPTTRTKGYELRANGCYVVAPPSLHPDTQKKYAPLNRQEVKRLPDMNDIVTWIKSRNSKPVAPTPKLPTTEPNFTTNSYEQNARTFYFNRALEGEIQRVSRSTEGDRNRSLNFAAFCIGGLTISGSDYALAERSLLAAALAVGTPEAEARRTITSGLTAGIRKPRPYPKPKASNNV
jgi:hypothetical protein